MNTKKEWGVVEEKLRGFIENQIFTENDNLEDFDNDTELVDSRIISSLSLIKLLAGIEEILDMEIINEDVGIEDFTTVNKIVRSVKNLII